MGIFETIRLALSLLPMIMDVVGKIEEAVPDSGQGSAKLALVKGTIAAGGEVVKDALPLVERLTSLVVAFFNQTGKFKKSA